MNALEHAGSVPSKEDISKQEPGLINMVAL